MSKRVKMLGIVAVLFTTTMLAQPVFSATAADDTVVAIVNGDKILKKDVMGALKNLPIKEADAEKVFPMVVEQVIAEKLIDGETVKAKIEESAAFKERLETVKAQMAKQMYIEQIIKDKVSDKAVKAEYEKFKAENKGKTEVHARHILVPTEEEAVQVIKDLDAGKKFEDLAKQRSSGPAAQNGGDLGYFVKEEMLPEFSEQAFKIKSGTYSKTPVQTKFGWHVIKVEDKRDRAIPAFKEVEMAIRNKLGQQAVEKLLHDLSAKADIQRFDMEGKPLGQKTEKN